MERTEIFHARRNGNLTRFTCSNGVIVSAKSIGPLPDLAETRAENQMECYEWFDSDFPDGKLGIVPWENVRGKNDD